MSYNSKHKGYNTLPPTYELRHLEPGNRIVVRLWRPNSNSPDGRDEKNVRLTFLDYGTNPCLPVLIDEANPHASEDQDQWDTRNNTVYHVRGCHYRMYRAGVLIIDSLLDGELRPDGRVQLWRDNANSQRILSGWNIGVVTLESNYADPAEINARLQPR